MDRNHQRHFFPASASACTYSLIISRNASKSLSNRSAEAHPPPTRPPAAQAPETASPVDPRQPAAAAVAAVTPVAESRAKETPPQGGSTQGEEETEGPQAAAAATTNLNSAKAEAKLVVVFS